MLKFVLQIRVYLAAQL